MYTISEQIIVNYSFSTLSYRNLIQYYFLIGALFMASGKIYITNNFLKNILNFLNNILNFICVE